MEETAPLIRYVIDTKVNYVHASEGKWWIHLNGSWESLCLGDEKPPFCAGDTVRITIERKLDALTC